MIFLPIKYHLNKKNSTVLANKAFLYLFKSSFYEEERLKMLTISFWRKKMFSPSVFITIVITLDHFF